MDPQPCILQLLSRQWFGNRGENNSSACVILIKKLSTNHILIKKGMTLFLQKSTEL